MLANLWESQQKVPSLDLRATDSGTIAKSRDGSTAPSDALDGAWSRQVGERTGVSGPGSAKVWLFQASAAQGSHFSVQRLEL